MSKTLPELRPWVNEDAPTLMTIVGRSEDLERQTGPLASTDDAQAVITRYQAPMVDGTGFVWAIARGEEILGSVGVTSIDPTHRTAWCWYWVADAARGQGLATRALAAAAQHAFAANVFRLELAHRVNNPGSRVVAARAGFISEGIERAKLEYDGVRHDCETHARLATDPVPRVEPLPVRPTDR